MKEGTPKELRKTTEGTRATEKYYSFFLHEIKRYGGS